MMKLFAPIALAILAVCTRIASATCRSNETHVVWTADTPFSRTGEVSQARVLSATDGSCWHEHRDDAQQAALRYLRRNVMNFDLGKLETLGFDADDDDADGLSNGIVGPSVLLALAAKQNYTWTDALPKPIFYEYVLNYANTNEARTNWRPLLTPVVESLLAQHEPQSTSDVVKVLNTHLWTALAPKQSDSIVFVSGQTPLIYDPMSVIAFGYASCTGLAILFVAALRAAGVAARVAGTPAWKGDRQQGNHNWVEVYNGDDDKRWYFMEPSPKQDTIDTLERDPCERWFCQKDRFGEGVGTNVWSARLDQEHAATHYPLAWEWNCTDVPGVDRTQYYIDTCSKC